MPLLLAYSPVAQPRAGRANQNPCEVVPLYEGLATGSSMLWQSTNGKSGLMGSRSAMGRKKFFCPQEGGKPLEAVGEAYSQLGKQPPPVVGHKTPTGQ
jgi:hypothetical protein